MECKSIQSNLNHALEMNMTEEEFRKRSRRDIVKLEQQLLQATANFLEYQDQVKAELNRKFNSLFGVDYPAASVAEKNRRKGTFVNFYKVRRIFLLLAVG